MLRLLVILSFITTVLNAQYIKNAGFENWHVVPGTSGQEDPDFWESNNKGLDSTLGYGVSKSTDAYSGNYALKLTPTKDPARSAQIVLGTLSLDSLGRVVNSQCSGYAVSYMPLVLTGYYKCYEYNRNTFAEITIAFTEGCTYSTQIDAVGSDELGPTSQRYIPFAIPIEFAPWDSVPPIDTMVIHISFVDPDTNSGSSYLLIDDLAVLGQYVGIAEENTSLEVAQLFPNPTKGDVTIESFSIDPFTLKVYSIHGKLLFEQRNILESEYQLQLNGPTGVYFVEVASRQGKRVFKVLKE